TLAPLTITKEGGGSIPLDHVPAGARVRLSVGWTLEDAETYPALDPETQVLIDKRESLRVSWFATAGALADEVTGRGEMEMETVTSNDWTAPSADGVVHLWVVLRDSRGGVDFAGYDLVVER